MVTPKRQLGQRRWSTISRKRKHHLVGLRAIGPDHEPSTFLGWRPFEDTDSPGGATTNSCGNQYAYPSEIHFGERLEQEHGNYRMEVEGMANNTPTTKRRLAIVECRSVKRIPAKQVRLESRIRKNVNGSNVRNNWSKFEGEKASERSAIIKSCLVLGRHEALSSLVSWCRWHCRPIYKEQDQHKLFHTFFLCTADLWPNARMDSVCS